MGNTWLVSPRLRQAAVCAALVCLSPLAAAVDVLVSSLTDAPDPASRGGQIIYAIEVQNQQADTAANVTLAFPLPATTSFVSVDDADCSHDGGSPGTVNCAFGNLLGTAAVPAGPVRAVNVTIASSAATGNTINVSATAATTLSDTNPANDTLGQNTTINDGADITTTLAPSPNPVTAGGNVTYTAAVTNNGPNDGSTVQVTFALSVNLTYVSGSATGSGWSCSGSAQTVTCGRASLASGATAPDIAFQAKVTGAQTGTITSTATVSAITLDPVPDNNVTTADVIVEEGTDVSVSISAAPGAVIEGNTTTVTIAPRNLGPFTAANVEVSYDVPSGFIVTTPAAGTGWNCSFADPTVTCTRGTYAVGATNDITIGLTAPSVAASTVYPNTAVIVTTTAEVPLANNTASTNITVHPNGVDLSVSKTKAPQPVAQGSPMTSTIQVHNNGPLGAAAGTITATDTLSAGEGYVGYTGANWSCVDSSPDIVCTYNAALNSGANSSNLVITTTAGAAGALQNDVAVSYSGTPGDYDLSNNTDSASVTSTALIADLQLTKTADAGGDSTLASTENTIVYTLVIANNGPDAADGIVLTDSIPGYVSGGTGVAVTSAPANYSCTTGSTVTCTRTSGSLSSGASDSFTIEVTRPIYGGSRTNTASAYSTTVGDDDRTNNTDSATVQVDPVADVQAQSKTVTPNPVKAGVQATYVITVRNSGPDTAANVQVVDTFSLAGGDTGFTFISAVASNSGGCSGLTAGNSYTSADAPALTCTWGSIARNSTRTVTLIVRPNYMAAPPDPRTMDNSVTVSMDTHDSDNGNDSYGPVTLTIVQDDIDLLINNSDLPDPVAWDPASGGDNASNDVVYHVSYTNNGPSYGTGVHYTYTMTPKAGKTVRFLCDEAGSADACGTSADTCSITGGSNPVTGVATLTLNCTASTASGKTDEMTAGSTEHRYLHFRILSQPDSAGDTHYTNATIAANETESNYGNNAEAESTSVRGRVDLAVTKSADSADVQLREPFAWTIAVTNNGPVASDVTQLTDSLPTGMDFHGATPSWSNAMDATSGTCAISGGNLTCDLGAMSVGASAQVTVPVAVETWSADTLQNCASATTNGVDVVSGNSTNVCGTVNVANTYFPSDYGDAPDAAPGTGAGNYATTYADGGPRHLQPGGTWMGACVDSDGAGSQQSVAADADDVGAGTVEAGTCAGSDDEDGVVFPAALVAGTNADLDITVSGADCALDGWVDFNADGDFDDAGERVFNALPLAAGTHLRTIAVPAGIAVGHSYARFRCSAAGGLDPTEEAWGGEVEDYRVSLQPDVAAVTTPTDYGDAPDTSAATGLGDYQTLLANDGASHVLGVSNAPYLGGCVDSDPVTQQNADASADDLGAAGGVAPGVTVGTCAAPGDDEDGVAFVSSLIQGTTATIEVTAASGTGACLLNAWVDYNANGDFGDAGEQVAGDLAIASGATATLTPLVPADATSGPTYARFRCASAGGLGPVGAAADGEVEDYRIEIRPNLSVTAVDYGDAPDIGAGQSTGNYPTTDAKDGPSHVLGVSGAPYLGSCVDSDDGALQNDSADADDGAAALGLGLVAGSCAVPGQDEDGVVFSTSARFNRGGPGTASVTAGGGASCVLSGWIDFNQDGVFAGDEQVVADQTQAAGATVAYHFTVPMSAELGTTYARFRCSSVGGLGATGPAPDGEVEDYQVRIENAVSIPTLNVVGMILLSLGLAGVALFGLGRKRV